MLGFIENSRESFSKKKRDYSTSASALVFMFFLSFTALYAAYDPLHECREITSTSYEDTRQYYAIDGTAVNDYTDCYYYDGFVGSWGTIPWDASKGTVQWHSTGNWQGSYCGYTFYRAIAWGDQKTCDDGSSLNLTDCSCGCNDLPSNAVIWNLSIVPDLYSCTDNFVNVPPAPGTPGFAYIYVNTAWNACLGQCVSYKQMCPPGTQGYDGICVEPRPSLEDCQDWEYLGQAHTLEDGICEDQFQCKQVGSNIFGETRVYQVTCGGDRVEGDETTDPGDEGDQLDINTTDETGTDRFCVSFFVSHNPDECKEECFSDESHTNLISNRTVACIYNDNNTTDGIDLTPVTSRQDATIEKMNDQISRLDSIIRNTDAIHDDLQETNDNLNQINEKIHSLIDNIQEQTRHIDNVANAVNSASAAEMAGLGDISSKLDGISNKLEGDVTAQQVEIDGAYGALGTAFGEMSTFIDNAKSDFATVKTNMDDTVTMFQDGLSISNSYASSCSIELFHNGELYSSDPCQKIAPYHDVFYQMFYWLGFFGMLLTFTYIFILKGSN